MLSESIARAYSVCVPMNVTFLDYLAVFSGPTCDLLKSIPVVFPLDMVRSLNTIHYTESKLLRVTPENVRLK